MTSVSVGAGAGFAGDRIEPAVDLARSGLCNAVVLECLAERTLVHGLTQRRKDPATGYDPRLRRRLEPLLPVALANRCVIVSNLGSANPVGAARAIQQLGSDLDLGRVRVAAITGDDVLADSGSVRWLEELGPGELLGAHAYLGADAIRRAVDDGAQVVVTGRVADASLFVGALGSEITEGLAGATAVGHLLECGGQITGGNYRPPGTRPAPSAKSLASLGYPLAVVSPDGTATITKLDGTGGRIDRLTCTLQLLYEVHDPRAYLTPDATIDLSGIVFDEVGPDEVEVSGARMVGVPEELKVVGFMSRPGTVVDLEIAYAGLGALDRARTAAEVLRLRLEDVDGLAAVRVDLVGVDSILRAASPPLGGDPPEVRVHASALCENETEALAVEDEIYALTLSGPAGGCAIRSERREPIEVVSGLIARDVIDVDLTWAAGS